MFGILNRCFFFLFFCGLVVNSLGSILWAQNEAKGLPPAVVSTAPVQTGKVTPQAEFVGTIFYPEVSDVAAEIDGRVEAVGFEEGQRVKHGQLLVELGSDILKKRRQATAASYEQVLSELEIARIDYKRKEALFEKKAIAEQVYDETRFRVKGLEKKASSLKAEVERLEIELQKKKIRAPYNGVVIKRDVDRGEWLAEGETLAVLAKDDMVDIVVQLPERYVPHIKTGMEVRATANGKHLKGNVFAIVPKADVSTRTFPVKIRTPNTGGLIEGMSATAVLPTGSQVETFIVPRDAVVSPFGQSVVFVVNDSRARMIPVGIVGYDGLNIGLSADGLSKGARVVVRGNERLRDGQTVAVQKESTR